MKKIYQKIGILALAVSMGSGSMSAQIAGIVTINSGSSTGGTNYNSFTDLATALNGFGVSGALTVNVVANSGPYNEQPNFTQAPGISPTNSILINGNDNVLSFSSSNSNQPWTLALGGADYLSINSLSVIANGSSYGVALRLYNNSNNNQFTNCTFSVQSSNQGSSNFMPVSVCATGNSYSGSGTQAENNNNIWNGCQMVNGYFGICFYGNYNSPYTLGNQVLNCNIRDFYVYGIYSYYNYDCVLKGNTIERPTATNISTFYGIYPSGTTIPSGRSFVVDGNRIRNPFGSNPQNTNSMFGIYCTMGGNFNSELQIKNNLLENLNSNGQIYGIYSYVNYTNIYHNTVSLDDLNSTYTGSTYGIYWYSSQSYAKNNLISISRGGSGSKYGFYIGSTVGTGTVAQNNNNVYVKPGTAQGYWGYHWQYGSFTSWSTWTATTQMDLQGGDKDPIYLAPNNAFVWPSTNAANYMPTSYALNDKGMPLNVNTDILNTSRSSTTPDVGAYEFLNVPCSGLVATSSVITPTTVFCPGTATINMGLSTTYTNNGMTFAWQSSTTSPVGPWNAVSGGTTQALTVSNLNTATWYQAIITCTNGNANTNATAGQVLISGVVVDNIPYFEGFEGIVKNNELPNCSWAANNLSTTCLTYTSSNAAYRMPRTGQKFASFYYNPGRTNYFYTNGINMNAGVTYSASVWYLTEALYSYNNWTDFAILINSTKSEVGATTIAATGNAAIALSYKSLSNTFTVSSSGIYYVIIKAIGTTISSAQYLSWDDLEIIAPCTNNMNTVPVSVTSNSTSVCSGAQLNLNASGGDSYLWSTGDTLSSITDYPFTGATVSNTVYIVTAKSLMSGCTATFAQPVTIKPTPAISISAFPPVSCEGVQVNLTAQGASTYSWSNGASGALISVTPPASITYTVLGTNVPYNCIGTGIQVVNINPKPTMQGTINPPSICVGETATLSATGSAVTYQWVANSTFSQSNPTIVSPTFSTIYTLTGTDNNGCTNVINLPLGVDACTGLNEFSGTGELKAYPNPTSGNLTIESGINQNKLMEVMDVTGRVVATASSVEENIDLDMKEFAAGIYYVKIATGSDVHIVKIVKQ
jgi:hypothetical protein